MRGGRCAQDVTNLARGGDQRSVRHPSIVPGAADVSEARRASAAATGGRGGASRAAGPWYSSVQGTGTVACRSAGARPAARPYSHSRPGIAQGPASLELKTSSTYLVGPPRRGHRLVGDVATGRYQVHGRKLTFLSGPYAHHFTGVYHPAGKNHRPHKENAFDSRFDLYSGGENLASCYAH